jgi:hypothetical protein
VEASWSDKTLKIAGFTTNQQRKQRVTFTDAKLTLILPPQISILNLIKIPAREQQQQSK